MFFYIAGCLGLSLGRYPYISIIHWIGGMSLFRRFLGSAYRWSDLLCSNGYKLPVGSCGCEPGDPHCNLICTRMIGHCGVFNAIGVAEGSLDLDCCHISELRLAYAIGRRSGLQERTRWYVMTFRGYFSLSGGQAE